MRTQASQYRFMTCIVCLCFFAAALSPTDAAADPPSAERAPLHRFFLELDGGLSWIAPNSTQTAVGLDVGWSGRFGLSFYDDYLRGFLHVSQSMWMRSEYEGDLVPGALNVAVGIATVLFRGGIRSSIAFGTSTLLYDEIFDKAGSTGWFVEVRPGGLRWSFGDWAIVLDPLTFAVMAPEPRGPMPLRRSEFATRLGLEVML